MEILSKLHENPTLLLNDDIDEVVIPKPKKPRIVDYADQLLDIEHRMCEELNTIQFGSPVTHIYNPLHYAAETHQCYVRRYGNSKKRVVFLGMNPGPFGMAQNGVSSTQDLLGWPRMGWVQPRTSWDGPEWGEFNPGPFGMALNGVSSTQDLLGWP